MYDEIVKTIQLTADEVELLLILLESKIDDCLSVGEEIIINDLFEVLK